MNRQIVKFTGTLLKMIKISKTFLIMDVAGFADRQNFFAHTFVHIHWLFKLISSVISSCVNDCKEELT